VSSSLIFPSGSKGIGRFVDRDMLMRYHWGLGIGHAYSHIQPALARNVLPQRPNFNAGERTSRADDLSSNWPTYYLDESEAEEAGSDSESEPECREESESTLGDYADIDGWDDFTFDEYEF
jgi:hypothetical protein